MPAPPPFLFILMGATSMLLQITVLRLLLSVFSGNELDIGITLSFWLIYVGIGSSIGKRFSFKHALCISFLLISFLSLPTAAAIKSVRAVLSLAPGEAASLPETAFATGLILLPLCLIIGIQFPLSVSYAGTSNPAGRVYGFESLGAFSGGTLFTFLISSRVSAPELCLMLSLISIAAAVYLSRKPLILLLSIFPLFFYLIFQNAAPSLSWPGAELTRMGESRSGEIAVVTAGNQASIYANGQLVFTYPDAQTDEMISHFPVAMHPSPESILVIGGSPGIFKELLKYPVGRVDFVELDPKMIDFSLGILNTAEDIRAINDTRVHIIVQDGRRFIKTLKNRAYDLIILNLPRPSTASINRFYTVEFFREARNVLRPDGILAMHLYQSSGYMGRQMQMASGSVLNALRAVFRYVEATSQEYGMLFSSDTQIDTAPDVLEKRFIAREIPVQHFHQFIFRDAFSSFGVDYVRQRLSEIVSLNTDFRPSAYLFNLMLWSEIHGGRFLTNVLSLKARHMFSGLLIVLICLAFFLFAQRTRTVSFSVFTTGFSGMSFVLTAILAYQSLHGYVYEMIGLLSASFMLGIWGGTAVVGKPQRPLLPLFLLDVIIICISIFSIFFFMDTTVFFLLVSLAGMICGAQFSIASLTLGSAGAGGWLYALDLFGSFIGALLSSLIVIPIFGLTAMLLLVSVLKAFTAAMILSLRPFRRD
jgi:spermidine synthase